MGNCCNTPNPLQKSGFLTLATLNYSGVQQSPYEFYETEDNHEKNLNKIFEEVCSKQYSKFSDPKFKWGMGKMDKQWHTRFSPLYNKKCGVKHKQLMTKTEFYSAWQETFRKSFHVSEQKIYNKLQGEQKEETIKRDKQECKIFDYCVYLSIVRKVYDVEEIKPGMSSKEYEKFQDLKFSKPYLNESLKIKHTINSLKNNEVDVLFLQEANQNILSAISEEMNGVYHLVERRKDFCTSAILLNKQKLAPFLDYEHENQQFYKKFENATGVPNGNKAFFFNEDSVIQAIGKVIFMSIHLSSKKQVNPNQIAEMNSTLALLTQKLPEYNFVIGSDLNGNYKMDTTLKYEDKVYPVFVYPNCEKEATVNKKRTMMQVQKNKANELNDGVKDYFVSNLKLGSTHIQTIKGIQVQKGKNLPLLPNSQHPYDHYLLSAQVQYKAQYFIQDK